MPKGYLVANIRVNDPEIFKKIFANCFTTYREIWG